MVMSGADAPTEAQRTPELSVVMPTRNVAPWVVESVRSVLEQGFADLELIVVDDGSTDGTLDLLAAVDDSRMTVLRNPGTGGGTARNHGVAASRGRYLAFADGDDLVPEGAYTALIEQARRSGSEMVVGSYVIFWPQQTFHRQQWLPLYGHLREGLTLEDDPRFLRDRVCWNRVIERAAWNEAGIRFADAQRSNDILAMTDAYCSLSFDVIPDRVYVYRRDAGRGSMTARKHAAPSIVAHFEQELACLASIKHLRSERIMTEYAAQMLEHDVWTHIAPLLEADRVAIEEDQPARSIAQRVLVELLPYGGASLDPARRNALVMAAAGDWEGAAILAGVDSVRTRRAVGRPAQLARRVRAAGLRANEVFPALLRSVYVDAIHAGVPDDTELLTLLREARRFARTSIPSLRVDARSGHVLSLDPSLGAAAVREQLASGASGAPMALRAASLALGVGRVAGRVARVGGDAARQELIASVRANPGPLRRAARLLPGPVRHLARRVAHRIR